MSFTVKDLEKTLETEDFNFQFDSREARENTVFFALKGAKSDGHSFLEEVARKGAKIAVVDNSYAGGSFGMKLVKVDDVVKTMQSLAKNALKRKKGIRVGITGSVGKTTTKEFSVALLERTFSVAWNLRSFNSQRGLPISILNFPREQDIIVMEMGMSEKGEMEKLSNIAEIEVGLITKVGLVHAINFDSLDEIIEEKMKVFCDKTKKKIVNYDLLQYVDKKEEYVTFSTKEKKADYFLNTEKDHIVIFEKNKVKLPKIFTETHLLEDFLASYALTRELGMTPEQIEGRLEFLKTGPLRFEKVEKNGVLFIKDCYNANGISTRAALENLPLVKGKKIAVLGDLKLGKFSQEVHEEMGELAAKKVDVLLTFGLDTKSMIDAFKKCDQKKAAFLFTDLKKLAEKINEIKTEGDLVLVKGTRDLEMERIFDFCL